MLYVERAFQTHMLGMRHLKVGVLEDGRRLQLPIELVHFVLRAPSQRVPRRLRRTRNALVACPGVTHDKAQQPEVIVTRGIVQRVHGHESTDLGKLGCMLGEEL